MKTTTILLLVTAGTASAFPTYEEYATLHQKTVDEDRRVNYNARVQQLQQHDHASFRVGVNEYTDWSEEERSSLFGLHKGMLHDERRATKTTPTTANFDLDIPESFPDSWDWTKKGACTPVKNQGQCGSCWAFAGSEAIESALFLSSGKLAELAPQSFLDCVPDPNHCGGTGGCEGNTFDLLYQYAANKSTTGSGMGGAGESFCGVLFSSLSLLQLFYGCS